MSASRDALAGRLALTGAALGVLAGTLELTVGPSMRHWVGDKQDTTRLGLATIVLSCLALAAAITLSRRPDAVSGRRVMVAAGLLLPALICLTTVGRLWYPPAALLLAAGGLVLVGTTRAEIAAGFDERRWRIGLLLLCGVYYVALGATALGLAGALGGLGGLLIWSAALISGRAPRTAYALLVCGAVPFAVATWWSVVTPLIAVTAIAVGRSVVRASPGRPEPSVRAGRLRDVRSTESRR